IYRFIGAEHVDEFFTSGSLRLSTFHNFSKHQDEQRRDTREASAMIMSGQTGGLQTSIMMEAERNALILCASLRNDQRTFNRKKYNGCFRIDRIIDFAAAVSRCIPGVIQFIQGFCIYNDNRIMSNEKVPSVSPTDVMDRANPNMMDPAKLQQIANQMDSPT